MGIQVSPYDIEQIYESYGVNIYIDIICIEFISVLSLSPHVNNNNNNNNKNIEHFQVLGRPIWRNLMGVLN